MSAPQIEALPESLGGIIIPERGATEPYPPAPAEPDVEPERVLASVTAIPATETTGPIEPVTEPEPPRTVRLEAAVAPRTVRVRPVAKSPSPDPSPTVERPEPPAVSPIAPLNPLRRILSAWASRAERTTAAKRSTSTDHTVPGWALAPLGVFMGIAAIAAFVLSFQMILPVVLAAGWTPNVAWLGPVVIDVAACAAAFMSVASRHPVFTRTGWFLLVTATALSITLNLAGHEINKGTHKGLVVPKQWDWTVQTFSVAVPVILAVLIHAFGKAFVAWMKQRRRPSPATTSSPKSAQKAPAKPPSPRTIAAGSESLKAELIAWARQNHKGAKAARSHFKRLGREVPAESTVKRWLAAAE